MIPGVGQHPGVRESWRNSSVGEWKGSGLTTGLRGNKSLQVSLCVAISQVQLPKTLMPRHEYLQTSLEKALRRQHANPAKLHHPCNQFFALD